MKRVIVILTSLMLGIAASGQTLSPCPGLKNPASFTAGSTSGVYVGYYSGQTGTKPSSAPNALTGSTGVNMTSAVIPQASLPPLPTQTHPTATAS